MEFVLPKQKARRWSPVGGPCLSSRPPGPPAPRWAHRRSGWGWAVPGHGPAAPSSFRLAGQFV